MEAHMSQDPLVSVVIPTRNRSSLVRRAIASVLSQTHTHLEVIVVDDASTDDTANVVAGVRDSRLRYLRHEVGRGGAAARNTGIRTASGDVIGFLDDDDLWQPEKVETQLMLLGEYAAVMCASNISANLSRLHNKKTVEAHDLRCGEFTAGGTSVLMARAGVLKSIMFDESLPRYQDWDLFIRISASHTIGYLNKPLVRYNDGDHVRITNSLLQYERDALEQQFRMLHKHREFFGQRWFRRHMSRALLYGVKHRPDKLRHVIYVMRRYGPAGSLRAMSNRVQALVRRKLERIKAWTRLPTRGGAL